MTDSIQEKINETNEKIAQYENPIVDEVEIQLECTCNDEFTTKFCPVHPPIAMSAKDTKYGEDATLIITDLDMAPVGYGYWEGFIFKCPSCGLNSIMVNPSMGGCCTNSECRRKIEVRSAAVTARIRSMSKQNLTKS